jgi:hypothetical protein
VSATILQFRRNELDPVTTLRLAVRAALTARGQMGGERAEAVALLLDSYRQRTGRDALADLATRRRAR